jgi:hypothetical protein
MNKLTRTRRVALAGAAVTLLAGGGAVAAVSASTPNPVPGGASRSIVLPGNPGQDLTFHATRPCRIVDTRFGGGALFNAVRTFNSSFGLAAQGGNAAGCGIPSNAEALQVNLTAVPVGGSSGYVNAWEAGTPEPVSSLVNFASRPDANMVTLPVNAAEQFNARVAGWSHLIADVSGYYTKPLYVAVAPGGTIYQGIASGVVSVTKTSTGNYDVVFDRNVSKCSPTASSIVWASNTDPSPDNYAGYGGNKVKVGVTNSSNAFVDDWFFLSLTC